MSRKLVLSVHLLCSVGWIGAAAAYLALGIAAAVSDELDTIRGSWLAMELVGWAIIVPAATGALITGVAMALITPWGLVRHYWVVFSLVLTSFSAVVLYLHMPTVSEIADDARGADPAALRALGGDIGHPAIGLAILTLVLVLNIFKPRGLTPYGLRRSGNR